MKKTITFDPSGNFGEKEGYGTTGWAFFHDAEVMQFGDIKSDQYKTQEEYFLAHEDLILSKKPDLIVCEGYRLYAGARGKAQINSTLDTPQLIGFLRMLAFKAKIPFVLQPPSDKVRVADPQLVKMGVFTRSGNKHYCMGQSTNLHMRDAIRHGIYYFRFGKGKKT